MNKPNIDEILAKNITKTYEEVDARSRTRNNKIQLCISFNADELDFIEGVAEVEGSSKAAAVRQIIRRTMKEFNYIH